MAGLSIGESEPPSHSAYISVGSNLGDKLACCRQGIAQVAALPRTELAVQSPFYRTAPVDYLDQDWFINAAIKVATNLAPEALLTALQAIQRKAGRTPEGDKIRFGPRLLDLDIIFYDDLVLDLPDLVVPHPRMHKRRFVLQPLCDIDPTIIHPVLKKDVQSILEDLDDNEQRIIKYR